jgi:hypothetical protein
LQYKLETSRTLHAPAKGTDSLGQTLANTKGECRGTFSPAQASSRKGIGSQKPKHEQPHAGKNRNQKAYGNMLPLSRTRSKIQPTAKQHQDSQPAILKTGCSATATCNTFGERTSPKWVPMPSSHGEPSAYHRQQIERPAESDQ